MGKKKSAADRMAAKLINVSEVSNRIEILFSAMESPHDLVCAIVATSFIDESLTSLLKEHFANEELADRLFDLDEGLVVSLRARSDMAYLLGLMPKKCKAAIDKIGEIRNLFAHTLDRHSFDDAEIGQKCDELLGKKLVPHQVFLLHVEHGITPDKYFGTRRRTFETVAGTIVMQLIGLANAIRKDQKFGGERHKSIMLESARHKS